MNENLQTQAEAYARATTSARCGNMGRCTECGIRFCDYRSRVDAFKAGYETALPKPPAGNRPHLTPNIQP